MGLYEFVNVGVEGVAFVEVEDHSCLSVVYNGPGEDFILHN